MPGAPHHQHIICRAESQALATASELDRLDDLASAAARSCRTRLRSLRLLIGELAQLPSPRPLPLFPNT